MNKSLSLSDHFRKAEALFQKQFPTKIEELETLWNHLRHVQWAPAPLEEMNRIAHTLAGSAATLRYQSLAGIFRELDDALRQMAQTGALPDSGVCHDIDQLFIRLHDDTFENSSLKPSELSNTPPVLHNAVDKLVYLVDDDPIVLEILGAQLKQSGYRVKTHSELASLYSDLIHETPSLIILDIVFPQGPLAGIEALQTLRVKTGFQIPVIFISARSDMTARLSALRAGGNAFYTKPVDIHALIESCQELMATGEEQYRALLVDDDQVCLLAHGNYLSEANFAVEKVSNPLEVLNQIHQFKPDVLVLDLKMPDCDGIEIARLLRQEKDFKFLPILFLSATEDPAELSAMTALESCEFLAKPAERAALVKTVLKQAREYQHLKNKLRELKSTDDSPFVVSRYEFFGRLDEKLIATRIGDESEPAYLIYLVLDALDQLRRNTVLRAQGQVNQYLFPYIEQGLKRDEIIAGQSDGVLLIMKLGSINTLNEYCQSLIERLHPAELEHGASRLSTQVSLGIVPLHRQIRDVHDAISRAEKMAAKARHLGGSRFLIDDGDVAADKRSDNTSDSKVSMADEELMEAVSAKRFSLRFQPIIHVGDPSFEAFEVLVRLQSESGEEFTPDQFIPLLERQKSMKELDRWIYAAAVDALRQDAHALLNAMLFLKVTRDTLYNTVIIPIVSNLLREARVKDQHRLVFLIKHHDILANTDQSLVFANQARAIGCQIGVENFSLEQSEQYLERLHPEYIKLSPKSLVIARKTEANRIALKTFTKNMQAKSSRIIVTAVENMVDMQSFYTWGIHLFQGYAIQVPGEQLNRNFGFENEEQEGEVFRGF